MNLRELTQTDLVYITARIPKDVRTLMIKYNLVCAGGFIRALVAGETPSDIDLFGREVEQLENAANELCATGGGRVHKTQNAITVLRPGRTPVQFITRWLFPSPESILQSFDFTVSQAAVYPFTWKCEEGDKHTRWESVCTDAFYIDLAARRLVYTLPDRDEDAGGSLMRARKFLRKGYTILAPSLAGVVARLMLAIDLDKLQAHDGGSEKWLVQVLTGLLREVDPLTVVDGVEVVEEGQAV